MPLTYAVKFHTGHGYIAYRVWESGVCDSGYLKVPDKYWKGLGYETPKEIPACTGATSGRCGVCRGCKEWKKLEQFAAGYAAKEAERRAQLLVDRALGRASKKMTLQQSFDLYQAEGRQGLDVKTRRRDSISFAAIARHIDVDDVLPEEVDEPIVVTFINARKLDSVRTRGKDGKLIELDKSVRHRTVNNEINLLERIVRFAHRWESRTGCTSTRFPDEYAMRNIRLPEQDSTMVAHSEEQLAELLRVVEVPWKRQVIIFGVCSMLREENLFGLRGEWIGWADDSLHIPAEFMKKGRAEKPRPLNRPLPRIAIEQLGAPRLQGYIWPNPETGMPYTRIYDLAELCCTASVPEISEHDLRTTGNTLLHTAGVDHLTRKALMGHAVKTGDVTDLYTKVTWARMQEAAAIQDALFARILKPQVKLVAIGDRRA